MPLDRDKLTLLVDELVVKSDLFAEASAANDSAQTSAQAAVAMAAGALQAKNNADAARDEAAEALIAYARELADE